MITFYKPVHLDTSAEIKAHAMMLMEQGWDFASEVLLRMPKSGPLYDKVNVETVAKGFGRISSWTIFCRGPYHKQMIHVDAMSKAERIDYGLLLPICGCDCSVMQWFDAEAARLLPMINPDGQTYLLRDVSGRDANTDAIAEVRITEDMIVNVGIPHRAVAGHLPRAALSIKFAGNPKLL